MSFMDLMARSSERWALSWDTLTSGEFSFRVPMVKVPGRVYAGCGLARRAVSPLISTLGLGGGLYERIGCPESVDSAE